MKLSYVLLAVLGCSMVVGALGDETCAPLVQQAKQHLEGELHQVRSQLSTLQKEKDAAAASLTTAQQTLASVQHELNEQKRLAATHQSDAQNKDAIVRSKEAELSTKQSELATKQQELATKQSELSKVTAELARLQAEYNKTVEKLQAELSAAKSAALDASDLLKKAGARAQAFAKDAADEAKLIFEELKVGNTSRLGLLAFRLYSAGEAAVLTVYRFVCKEYEEHVPENVKQQIKEAIDKVQGLWNQHVVEAAWAKEVTRHVSTANNELKEFLTAKLKAQPSLAHLADPVYVQLIVYVIIGAPLLLLFLPVLLLVVIPALSSGDSTSSSRSSKKKKKGPKTSGIPLASKGKPARA
mmetsp:Transcript_11226/g.24184  ORF Transcript_11226/g.24184 Transcript_11226/m.24184 type:complete len:356 (+) Transcript_11226:184-1251(+)|eukprot:CAMPEP_0202902794 /NCGR_PEP_ID=MMETSP1392-20130828/17053_1 /ASSEMBLY_ACC=CAM_ASM_000868 /TAXON_ID=225041 /ORGANISM="Chlamydomonas chlamydogama, Strain SAG 11-48b" /LENGTH=355 /DNA_ID=CAMNT_0049589601 /DNA_START=176 /DNA_END=1243 /DNA_ORIENTATION=-